MKQTPKIYKNFYKLYRLIYNMIALIWNKFEDEMTIFNVTKDYKLNFKNSDAYKQWAFD